MAQSEKGHTRAASTEHRPSIWRRFWGRDNSTAAQPLPVEPQDEQRPGIARRISRKVVPGLPRPGTFKRQQSELRDRLELAIPNPEERRAVSVDRRRTVSGRTSSSAINAHHPRLSAPIFFENGTSIDAGFGCLKDGPSSYTSEVHDYVDIQHDSSLIDARSVATNDFDDVIQEELKDKWILNLSMHFRDKSNREKFFVTYAETPTRWRRVTVSVDYRNAPQGSLEEELQRTKFQRDKSARIYESIRESLPDIQFYETVTNLKLQTESERLHVHVVEDLSEIVRYPPASSISHLRDCRRYREEQLVFDSHLSGFVYKVKIDGEVFIKKEIPGPDTVDEFLYEINALYELSGSRNVIQFGGVVLDNKGQTVKGLLISFAEQGALIDVLYDGEGRISWEVRQKWAKQIVQGLSEIHEAGFVQGDFTLSNIVIDEHDNAKIIDINRRGCPVGWEPPEVAALLKSSQRISMYIGVKSDLYQLGMVLYALAMQEDEPENHRPLDVSHFPPEVPQYFLDICSRCLDDNPRNRSSASMLLTQFPHIEEEYFIDEKLQPIVVEARSPPMSPTYHSIHLDRSNTFGRNGFFDNYATTETSEEMNPRRGRSPRRSPTPPMRRWLSPKDVPLPLSVAGSGYHDFAYDPPLAKDVPLPPSTAGSESYDYFHAHQNTHEALTPISEISHNHEILDPLENKTEPTTLRESERTPRFEDPRKTEAVDPPPTPPATVKQRQDELAGIGELHTSSSVEYPAANLDDDDLTTDVHI